MSDDAIHKWLDGQASDEEMQELAATMGSDNERRDDAFAYMLLESELAYDHRPPLRIVTPSTARRGLRRMTVILSGAAAALLIGFFALMVFNKPAENEKIPWYIAEIERTESEIPVAPFVAPPNEESGGVATGGRKGGTDGAPGGPPEGGSGDPRGKPGNPAQEQIAKALETFARQFTFAVRFPEGLPPDFRLLRAKRIMPSAGGAEAETAMLIYASGEKKVIILESTSEMASQGLPEGYRHHQRMVGNLRISCLGASFDAPSWEALIDTVKF